jgi:hypothetical protein
MAISPSTRRPICTLTVTPAPDSACAPIRRSPQQRRSAVALRSRSLPLVSREVGRYGVYLRLNGAPYGRFCNTVLRVNTCLFKGDRRAARSRALKAIPFAAGRRARSTGPFEMMAFEFQSHGGTVRAFRVVDRAGRAPVRPWWRSRLVAPNETQGTRGVGDPCSQDLRIGRSSSGIAGSCPPCPRQKSHKSRVGRSIKEKTAPRTRGLAEIDARCLIPCAPPRPTRLPGWRPPPRKQAAISRLAPIPAPPIPVPRKILIPQRGHGR